MWLHLVFTEVIVYQKIMEKSWTRIDTTDMYLRDYRPDIVFSYYIFMYMSIYSFILWYWKISFEYFKVFKLQRKLIFNWQLIQIHSLGYIINGKRI